MQAHGQLDPSSVGKRVEAQLWALGKPEAWQDEEAWRQWAEAWRMVVDQPPRNWEGAGEPESSTESDVSPDGPALP